MIWRSLPHFTAAAMIILICAVPAWAAANLADVRIAVAPDGVLFLIHDGARYRVTPQQMSASELGAIPEGAPLAVGRLDPSMPIAQSADEPRIVRPSPQMGLSRQQPIPLGWTCSCTTDRSGQISQFDITVIRVDRDALGMVLGANRFNKPPRPGNALYGVLVDMKYIRGPEDQAFSVAESDYRASGTDGKLRDPSSLIGFSEPVAPAGPIPGSPVPQLRGDLYPGSTLNGWVFFELPRDEAVVTAWEFSYQGERAVWFALQ